MKKREKCYIYTRVSTSMQVDGYSLDAQKDKLRKYADYQDMIIAGEYSDEGHSGKNIQGRAAFRSMLDDNISKAHYKDKKTRYYYYCKNNMDVTGHKCTFRKNIDQTELDDFMAALISAMVKKPQFEKALRDRIGHAVSTDGLTGYPG